MNAPPSSDLGRVGLVVGGKFRLDAIIGRGAMGTVWTATHVGLGHNVAIKLVAREFVKHPEALRRFDAEAKAVARLQSRHVVQVFDNGTLDDGTPYIAMELLAGENLEQRIERTGPLPLGQAVDVLAQCCKALARAHAAGIVHRDIKPENVYLARVPDDDTDVVKILDFGVAKVTMALEGWTSKTGTGAMLGTPIYMSPEQVRASKDVDQRSDLYSLGLVAFRMLTGRLVVEADTFGEVLLKICTQPLPSLVAAAPGLPPSMDPWFYRVCARDAVERCPSAQDFIDTLRAAAGAPSGDARATPQPRQAVVVSAGASSMGAALARTESSVSVTSAGIRGVKSGAVLAAVLTGALVLLGGGALFLLVTRARETPPAPEAPVATTPVATAPSASARALLHPGRAAPEFTASPAVDADAASDASPSASSQPAVAKRVAPATAPPAVPAPAAPPAAPTYVAPGYAAPTVARPPPPYPPAQPPSKPKFNLGY